MASPTLDDYMSGVVTSDTKKRIEMGEALSVYLQDNDCSLCCEEMDKFMEGLAGLVSSSNFKVSLLGLQVLSMLVDRMGAHFKPHVTTVLSNVVDRLGDEKDQVREGARELIIKMMSKAAPPQFVLEGLQSAFTHKLWKVKEELLICIQRCLDEFGAKNMGVSKIVPQIVKLLDDQSIPVRDQAVTTLVEMYRHVGENLRNDLSRREINPNRMAQILMKMDELQAAGLVMDNDDTDSVQSAAVQQQFTKPAAKLSTSSTRTSSASSSNSTAVGGRGNKAAAGAGAVDEESFTRSFEDVPKIHIFTVKDLTDYVTKIKDTLSDTNADWEKRVEALKLIRALVIQEGTQFSEFSPLLHTLENCVKLSLTDLRSQVVREACITTSFLSERLGTEFDRFAEALVPALIQLIPNSTKVMATSGDVALRFIVQYTHTPRIIPLITTNLTSKSSVIRKQCCELLDLMLRTCLYNTSVLERQASVLQDALKKGLTDADSEARVHSRKFVSFLKSINQPQNMAIKFVEVDKVTDREKIEEMILNVSIENTNCNNNTGEACDKYLANMKELNQKFIDHLYNEYNNYNQADFSNSFDQYMEYLNKFRQELHASTSMASDSAVHIQPQAIAGSEAGSEAIAGSEDHHSEHHQSEQHQSEHHQSEHDDSATASAGMLCSVNVDESRSTEDVTWSDSQACLEETLVVMPCKLYYLKAGPCYMGSNGRLSELRLTRSVNGSSALTVMNEGSLLLDIFVSSLKNLSRRSEHRLTFSTIPNPPILDVQVDNLRPLEFLLKCIVKSECDALFQLLEHIQALVHAISRKEPADSM